jgi:hypothetical protein
MSLAVRHHSADDQKGNEKHQMDARRLCFAYCFRSDTLCRGKCALEFIHSLLTEGEKKTIIDMTQR